VKVTPKKSKGRTTNANSGESAIDLEEQIRRRAYELYGRRSREDGGETEDWLQAETELARERTMTLAVAAVKKVRKSRSQAPKKQQPSRLKKSRSSAQSQSEEEAGNGP
jgi:hypothetical protein